MKRVFWDVIAIFAPANRKARERRPTVERMSGEERSIGR